MALENHDLTRQKILNEVIQNSTQAALRNRRAYPVPPVYSLNEDRMDVDESGTWGDGAKKKKYVSKCSSLS